MRGWTGSPKWTLAMAGALGCWMMVCDLACRQALDLRELEAEACVDVGYAAATCRDCMVRDCCDVVNACEADPQCSAGYECLARCNKDDSACRIACEGDLPQTNEAFSAAKACRTSRCSVDCATCAGIADGFGADCDSCIAQRCCEEEIACAADAECLANTSCVRHGSDPDVVGACYGDTTNVTSVNLRACFQDFCVAACAVPPFECVGRFSWPKAPHDASIEYTIVLDDLISQLPQSGLTVKACATGDLACATPLATGTTGDDGRAVLRINVSEREFRGFLDVTDARADIDDAHRYIHDLLILDKPVVKDESRGFAMVTQDALDGVGTIIGMPIDASKGHIAVSARNCYALFASGVEVSLDPSNVSQIFYYKDGLPSRSSETTDASGTAIAANVDPTPGLMVQMTLDGERVGQSTIPVVAGAITTVLLYPDEAGDAATRAGGTN